MKTLSYKEAVLVGGGGQGLQSRDAMAHSVYIVPKNCSDSLSLLRVSPDESFSGTGRQKIIPLNFN